MAMVPSDASTMLALRWRGSTITYFTTLCSSSINPAAHRAIPGRLRGVRRKRGARYRRRMQQIDDTMAIALSDVRIRPYPMPLSPGNAPSAGRDTGSKLQKSLIGPFLR
jgi:hypothetical protein